MSIQTKSLSLNLESKSLRYPDDFYSLKGNEITPSNSFSYFEYEALKNPEDIKTNNFSNLIITKKDLTSNWLKANIKDIEDDTSIITTISFILEDNKENVQYWLYFDKEQNFSTELANANFKFVKEEPKDQYDNFLFYINFLPNNQCMISHTFSDVTYYLSYEDNKICFLKAPKNNSNIFNYNFQDSLLKILKVIAEKESEDSNEIVDKIKILGLSTVNNTISLKLKDDIDSKDNIIRIKSPTLDYNLCIDNSFVNYDKSLSIQSVSSSSSVFSLPTQYLIHHEYANDFDVNFIQLKNNHTYKGNSVRGETLEKNFDINYPTVNYRTYNSISSGINQEYGNDNIILTFTFHDQEYTINDGEDLIITIPSEENNYGINPIYPYKQINIKDTTFIQSGAFGSDVPYFSDRFKKKQLKFFENNNTDLDNATYLCTWLHKENNESKPEWLDRWYYPDRITRSEVLKAECYNQSFNNIIDKVYKNYSDIDKQLLENSYFDKKSDLIIEPDSQYKYTRISSDDVNVVLNSLEKYRIKDIFNQNIAKTDIKSNLTLDGKNYRFIKGESFNKTNAINLNFDLYIDPKKKYGIQLFGTDYNHGFNIQNRHDIAPFHYYISSGIVYLLNNDYEVKHSFNVFEKYNEIITHLVLGNQFEDIMVITKNEENIYFYIFSFDLSLKSKFDFNKIGIKDITILNNFKKGIENSKCLTLWNNNLYVPYGQGIYKLILSKDSIKDYDIPNDKIGLIRSLDEDEYHSCFNQTEINGTLTDSESNFKTLYFDKNGDLYAFNYDQLAIGADDDTGYGIFNSQDVISSGEWYYLYAQSLSKMKVSITSSRFPMFGSPNSIDFVKINSKGDIALVRGFNDPSYENEVEEGSNNEKEIQEKKLEIYDVSKALYYTTPLTILDKVLSLDTYTYIDNGVEKCVFSLIGISGDESNSLVEIEYIHGDHNITTRSIDIKRMNDIKENLEIELNGIEQPQYNENKFLSNYDNIGLKKQMAYKLCQIADYNLDDYNKDFGAEENLDSWKVWETFYNNNELRKSVKNKISVASAIKKSQYTSWEYFYENKIKKIEEEIEKCLPHLIVDNFYQLTNSDSIIRYTNDNSLYFNLFLQNNTLYDTKLSKVLDYSTMETGWYNFNIAIDLDTALFELRINDEIYNNDNDNFVEYVNSNRGIFDTNYYIGCLSKQHGITLNNILENNSTFDPYICNNTQIRNMIIFNKVLNYHEYLAMRLEEKPIQPLTILIPCGSRTMIEEIVRYFRFNIPTNISNKVKINIGGIKNKFIKTKEEYSMLANEILKAIDENSDTLVDVKEIEFI